MPYDVVGAFSHRSSSHWGAAAVDPAGCNLPALKMKFLLNRMPTRGRVLEIGSGDGKVLRTLAQQRPGLDLSGCDVRTPTAAPDVYRFRSVGADGAVPFDSASLDVVLMFDVLEHVPDPTLTLCEAARVLKPCGRLVAFIPVEGELASFYEFFRRVLGRSLYVETKEHLQSFTHDGLRALIERDFAILEVRYAYHALGHMMDAAFFAAHRIPWLRDFWWRENAYYNGPEAACGLAGTSLNRLIALGNLAAWAESFLLGRIRAGAAGVLVEAVVRRD